MCWEVSSSSSIFFRDRPKKNIRGGEKRQLQKIIIQIDCVTAAAATSARRTPKVNVKVVVEINAAAAAARGSCGRSAAAAQIQVVEVEREVGARRRRRSRRRRRCRAHRLVCRVVHELRNRLGLRRELGQEGELLRMVLRPLRLKVADAGKRTLLEEAPDLLCVADKLVAGVWVGGEVCGGGGRGESETINAGGGGGSTPTHNQPPNNNVNKNNTQPFSILS